MVALTTNRCFDILITDDDKSCREAVGEVLDRDGYRTHLASCGQEAIEFARHTMVHVAIVDMNMPGMSGVETITIIRHEVSESVPSILMSADRSRELMRQAIKAHFDSFLHKPLDLRALRDIVGEIICKRYLSDS